MIIKNRSKFYSITILSLYILVYFFKIDKDPFSVQEYFNRPNQIYTEQPLAKSISYFAEHVLDFPQSFVSCDADDINIEEIAIWNSIFLSYNSRVHHLLKFNKFHSALMMRNITALYRQNILHKSSEEEEPEYRYTA